MLLVNIDYIPGKDLDVLGIVKGTTITLIADGVDEKEAVDALTSLIESNFGE